MSIISDLRSDERTNRYILLGNVHSETAWEIGRLVLQDCADLDRAKAKAVSGKLHGAYWTAERVDKLMAVGYMHVYADVASLVGKGSRRVRQYAQVAQFYSPAVQDQYSILPHSHFEFALRFGVQWQNVLETAVQQMGRTGGRPPSVDWLEVQFRDENAAQVLQYQEIADWQYSLADPTADAPALPGCAPAVALAFQRLVQAVGAMRNILRNLSGIPPERIRRITDKVAELADEIAEVAKENENEKAPV